MSGSREFSQFAVAQLRTTLARYPHDDVTRALLDELVAGSAEYAELWRRAEVDVPTHTVKRVDHPGLGRLELTCDVLVVPHDDQQVVLLSAASGTPTESRLRDARAEGWISRG